MNDGSVSPDSVEKKAHTLTGQTLDAVRPVTGGADTSVEGGAWQKCTTETPGKHRFQYTYTLRLAVPQDRSQAVMDAAKAHFTQQGYRVDVPDPKTARVSATEQHSSWWVGVGVAKDTASMFISANSDCVFTTHDPPTTGGSS